MSYNYPHSTKLFKGASESNCRERTTTSERQEKKPYAEKTKAETSSTSHKDK